MTRVCVISEYSAGLDPAALKPLVKSDSPFSGCIVVNTPVDKISEFQSQFEGENISFLPDCLDDSNITSAADAHSAQWVILIPGGTRLDYFPGLNFESRLEDEIVACRIRITDALGMSINGLQMTRVGPEMKLAPNGKSFILPDGKVRLSVSMSIYPIIDADSIIAESEQIIGSASSGKEEIVQLDLAAAHELLGNPAEALAIYKSIIEKSTGSQQELWHAWYRVILITRGKDSDRQQICAFCEEAFNVWPERAETLVILAQEMRENQEIERASGILEIAESISTPEDNYYFNHDTYDMGIKMERFECDFASGNYSSALTLGNEILSIPRPSPIRNRITKSRDIAYEKTCPVSPLAINEDNRFLIISTFRNAGDFLQKCIDSVKMQKYHSYRVVFVDDASDDGAPAKADFEGLQDYLLIVNDTSIGALKNQTQVIREYAKPEDIVVFLDGDDWFAHDDVLGTLNRVYNETDCWVTFGQFQCSNDDAVGYARPLLPDEVISETYKMGKLLFPIHLRTYRAGLHLKITEQDENYTCFTNEDGDFISHAYDVAQMRAVMLMAGVEKIRYIPEVLYIYNTDNPLSHFASERPELNSAVQYICGLPELHQVNSYLPAA